MNGHRAERWIELVQQPIDTHRLVEFVSTPAAGAVVLFLGTVRELTHGRRTLALDYEAYPEMALAELTRLIDEAVARWPVQKVAVLHRLGHLDLGEASVGIALSCPHRKDAFEAGQYLIDELKIRVPIWKKEHWDDGTTEWIHPGMDGAKEPPA